MMKPNWVPTCSWDRLERELRTLRSRSPAELALSSYFGEEQLARLLRRIRTRRPHTPASPPTVVLVPGIMASRLSVTRGGEGPGDLVWIDFLRLMNGGLEHLALAPDGVSESDPRRTVRVEGIDRRTSADVVLALRQLFIVREFSYDWRLPLTATADLLAADLGAGRVRPPVHVVAHSMGGLVFRTMVARHPALWKRLGGQCVMAGTPHRGSFLAVKALTGEEELLRLLAAVDLRHSRADLLDIVAGFPSCYQMLPFREALRDGCHRIYNRKCWEGRNISQTHLNGALRLQRLLTRPLPIDLGGMTCIAGNGRTTITGMRINADGSFAFSSSAEGDGSVPAAFAGLAGSRLLVVREEHGRLLANDTVLEAVVEIIATGRTEALPGTPGRTVVSTTGPLIRSRSAGALEQEQRLSAVVRASAGGPQQNGPIAEAERILLGAAIGAGARLSGPTAGRAGSGSGSRLSLRILNGDVRDVRTPLLVVGHYAGVPPVRAIGAIDSAMGRWISSAIRSGGITGGFGQLSFVPVLRPGIAAKTVLVLGMGTEGELTSGALRGLVAGLVRAMAGLGYREFAAVLLGSGLLGTRCALEAMLDGAAEAMNPARPGPGLRRITIVESNPRRALLLERSAAELVQRIREAGCRLAVTRGRIQGAERRRRITGSGRPARTSFGVRLAIERCGDLFRYSLMTSGATIPVREVEIQDAFREQLCAGLTAEGDLHEQRKRGRVLAHLLIPGEFRSALGSGGPVTLILDRATCGIPWEMLDIPGGGRGMLGLKSPVVRQLKTLLPAGPVATGRPDGHVRVLVIADPAHDADLRLPGAEREGRVVAELLRTAGRRAGRTVSVVERIGPASCDPEEILTLLLDGAFDCVHYAGHGVYVEANPSHSGWVLGRGRRGILVTISAREMFRARKPPRLVFANACLSGRVRAGRPLAHAELNRRLAGLAEAFFAMGVSHYIGTGWQVDDAAAVLLAREFYARLLPGDSVASALWAARRVVARSNPGWGAYHHYGNAAGGLWP